MATTPAHNRLRILFVDDEAHLQEFMRTELPRLGHEVTVCPDGKSGIKAVKKATFDAAILDLRMDPTKPAWKSSRHSSRSRRTPKPSS